VPGHPGSMKPNMMPRLGTLSRLHIKPAQIYSTDDAAMLASQVMGYSPSLKYIYKSYDQLAENIYTHTAMNAKVIVRWPRKAKYKVPTAHGALV